jgi:hypothetical protein
MSSTFLITMKMPSPQPTSAMSHFGEIPLLGSGATGTGFFRDRATDYSATGSEIDPPRSTHACNTIGGELCMTPMFRVNGYIHTRNTIPEHLCIDETDCLAGCGLTTDGIARRTVTVELAGAATDVLEPGLDLDLEFYAAMIARVNSARSPTSPPRRPARAGEPSALVSRSAEIPKSFFELAQLVGL